MPDNPRPWLISTARFKAIDTLRRRARFDASQDELARHLESRTSAPPREDDEIEDDRLRLIFTCCHPSLSPEARVALTLREVYAAALMSAEHEYREAQSTQAKDDSDPARARYARALAEYDKLQGQFPFVAAGLGDAEV